MTNIKQYRKNSATPKISGDANQTMTVEIKDVTEPAKIMEFKVKNVTLPPITMVVKVKKPIIKV